MPATTNPIPSTILTATLGVAIAAVSGDPSWLAMAVERPLADRLEPSLREALSWIGGILGNRVADRWSEHSRHSLPDPAELVRNHDLERLAAAALSRAFVVVADDTSLGWTSDDRSALQRLGRADPGSLATVFIPLAEDPPLDVTRLLDRLGDPAFDTAPLSEDARTMWTTILSRLFVVTGVRFPGPLDRVAGPLDRAYWQLVRELLKHEAGGKAYRALEIQATAWLVVAARQNRDTLRELANRTRAGEHTAREHFEVLLQEIRSREPLLIETLAKEIHEANDRTTAALRSQSQLFGSLGRGLDRLLDAITSRLDRIEGLQRELLAETRRRDRLELPPTAQAAFDYLTATQRTRSGVHDGWQQNEDGSTDLVMQEPDGSGLVWYCCVEGWATESHVDSLQSRRAGATGPCRMVTSHRLLDGVMEYAAVRGIQLLSLRSLIIDLLRLGRYEDLLQRRVTERVAEEDWFVPPRFSVESRSRHALDRTISDGVDGFLEEWILDSTPEATVLLGDYGAGKSAVVSRIARDRFLSMRRPQDRLPILLRAADRPSIRRFDDLLEEFGIQSGSLLADPAVFRSLADAGRLFVILDGLDELIVNRSGDTFRAQAVLAQGIDHRTKLLVTCRSNAFRTAAEESGAAGVPGEPTHQPFVFWRIRLEPFDESHVRSYLARRLSPDMAEQVAAMMIDVYDLMSLAHQPVLLDMIVSNWDEVRREIEKRPGERIEVGDLYRVYTNRWLEDAGRPGAVLRPVERVGLMRRIAVWMEEQGEAEMPADELPARLEEVLGRFGSNEAVEREVLLQSFLIRSADDRYYFAHRSFLEYFLSMEVAAEIAAGTPRLLHRRTLQPEIIQFVSVHGLTTDQVWSLLRQSLTDAESATLNANLLSVLRDLDPATFAGRNLAGLRASDADLRRADFREAVLEGCHLKGCDIRDADFSRARLAGSTLEGLILGVRSAAKCVRFATDGDDLITADSRNWVLRLPAGGGPPVPVHQHLDSVTSVSTSASGVVASGGFDGRVRLTDPATGRHQVLTTHGTIVYGVAIRPDGNHVASTDAKGRLKIWDRRHDRVVLDKVAHGKTAYTVEWSRCGEWLAIGSFDRTASLWRFANGTTIRLIDHFVLDDHQALVNGVRFSPDGSAIAAASNNGSVRVWRLSDRAEIARYQAQGGDGDIEWAVAFAPDGTTLASGGHDGVIRLWDVRDGRPRTIAAHDAEIWSLDFNPTGTRLASGSFDGRVRIWDVATGTCVGERAFDQATDGLKMDGADLRGVRMLSGLQRAVLAQAGGMF